MKGPLGVRCANLFSKFLNAEADCIAADLPQRFQEILPFVPVLPESFTLFFRVFYHLDGDQLSERLKSHSAGAPDSLNNRS